MLFRAASTSAGSWSHPGTNRDTWTGDKEGKHDDSEDQDKCIGVSLFTWRSATGCILHVFVILIQLFSGQQTSMVPFNYD